MSEDQFSSVRLDRGSKIIANDPIDEENDPSDSDMLGFDGATPSSPGQQHEHVNTEVTHSIDNNENTAQKSSSSPTSSLILSTSNVDATLQSNDRDPQLAVDDGLMGDDGNSGENEDRISKLAEHETQMNEYFEKYFIKATVSEPIRDVDQSSKPFISYLVTTETDNPSLIKLTTKVTETQIKVSVRRRYGDFRNLYHCLNNDFPFLLIPPLPSKSNLKYLTGDTFSQEFVHKRLNSLNRFIKFINGHKILSQSSVYHLFLSDSNDWLSFSKNIKISNISDVEKEQSFTSNMVNKVVNEELIAETVMNFLTPSKHKKETNKEILEITDKLKKMYENLLKLDKIFARLSKKNSDLSIDYHLFSQQIEKLAVVNETCNTDLVSINDNFKFFAECLNQYSENWSKSFTFINESFLTSLKDCSKYIVNLTNLIELQHNKKIDLQVLQEYLDKARNELNSFPATSSGQGTHRLPPSPIKNKTGGIVNNTTQLIRDTLSTSANGNISSSNTETKRAKLEAKVHQLEHEVELQTNLVQELINKITNEEYPNWDKFNKTELKSSMLELCDNQIDFYKGLVDNWNDTESKLMKRINELT